MAKEKKTKETKKSVAEKNTSKPKEVVTEPKEVKEEPKQVTWEEYELLVREKAYTLYLERGEAPGSDTEDWEKAEMLVKQELNIK